MIQYCRLKCVRCVDALQAYSIGNMRCYESTRCKKQFIVWCRRFPEVITSAQYASNWLLCRALATSFSFIKPPRAVFTNIKFGLDLAKSEALTNSLFSAFRGQFKLMMSHCAKASASETLVTPCGNWSALLLLTATMCMPIACMMRAIASPIFPKPTIPKVFPANSQTGFGSVAEICRSAPITFTVTP